MRSQGTNDQRSIPTAVIANHENKYKTDLLLVPHPQDSNLGPQHDQDNQIKTYALDRSAKIPLFVIRD